MKRKFIPLFILFPVVSWAGPKLGPNRLVIMLHTLGGVPCETINPGSKPSQVGPNYVLAGAEVVLRVVATDPNYNPVWPTRTLRIGVLDPATLPFLARGPDEFMPWDTVQLVPGPTWSEAYDTVVPYRATCWQRGAYPKDILEYLFVVEDIEGAATDTLFADTSSPLDSVIPNPPVTLLLTLPGERHYPGDFAPTGMRTGKRGMPLDWDAGRFYDCCVYMVDPVYNAVPFSPMSPESCLLEVCLSSLIPDSIDPERGLLFTEVPHDDVIDSVAKLVYKVSYPKTGYAGLRANGFWGVLPAGTVSECAKFRVVGEPPDSNDWIDVIPNPCGTPGLPAVIIIHAVPLGGGRASAKLYDAFGYLIRDFSDEINEQYKHYPFAKFWRVYWDGTNEKGHKVANGCYHLCVEIIQVEKAGVWKEKIGVVW